MQFRLSEDLTLSDLPLLGQTEAKLPTDGFSIVDPLDGSSASYDLMLEIAGFRYYVSENSPLGATVGEPLLIAAEPDNVKDPHAVQVLLGSRKIGNINRLQTQAFHRWLAERRVSAVLERLNGNAERPRGFVFIRVRPNDTP